MARTLKATILMLSEATDETEVIRRAIAKYIVGDDADPTVHVVKFKEVAAPDFATPAGTLYDAVVASIKVDEGIE